MANCIFNEAKRLILVGGIGGPLAAMLVRESYVPNPDQIAIDDGTVSDPASHELSVGGYARKTLTNMVIGKDIATDFAYMDADDVPFGALLAGQTIGGILVYKEGATDGVRVPFFFYETPDTPTNGSQITVQWASIGAGALLKATQAG